MKIYSFPQLITMGKDHPEIVLSDPTPDTIFMFCYTSGTTGDPKGAMLSHKAMLAAIQTPIKYNIPFTCNEIAISYLPYAHIFEQCAFIFSLTYGYSHGYFSGSALTLMDDCKVLKPTIMITVPRILNRIHGMVIAGVNAAGGVKKMLFEKAIRDKTFNLDNNKSFTHKFYDKVVFSKV